MTVLIVALLIAILGVLMVMLGVLFDMRRSAYDTVTEVRDLRLTSRTRVSRASVQSGVADPERKLVRLGRATKSRRVVVGGDGDSDLNRVLSGLGEKEEAGG